MAQQKRFMRRGIAIFKFSPVIANIHSVTRSELTAATDITDWIADIAGWSIENASIPVPDMGSTFAKTIPGEDSAADSSFTFYEDQAGDDVDILLPKGTEGFVLILRKGDIPGDNSLGTYPVRSSSKSPEFSAGNEPARQLVGFGITDEPELDGPIPPLAP